MYKPSPETTVVIPFTSGPEQRYGPIVNDAYFGKVPAGYMHVSKDAVFFKGDGTRRGKIGISPKRSKGIASCGTEPERKPSTHSADAASAAELAMRLIA